MSRLMLCDACQRHFRLDDARCPFCATDVTDAARERAAQRVVVTPGTSRAKRYAASMAFVASSAALACGSSESNGDAPGTGGMATGGSATGGTGGSATGGTGGSTTGGTGGSATGGTGGSSGSATGGTGGSGTGGSQAGAPQGGQAQAGGGQGGRAEAGGGPGGKAGGGQGGGGQGAAGGFLAHPYGCVWPDDEDV